MAVTVLWQVCPDCRGVMPTRWSKRGGQFVVKSHYRMAADGSKTAEWCTGAGKRGVKAQRPTGRGGRYSR